MEDWALIRRLAAEGVPKVRIAERLGVSRSTVIKAVASDAPPKYVRRAAEATSFTPFEARVRWLLDETLSPGIIPALCPAMARPGSGWQWAGHVPAPGQKNAAAPAFGSRTAAHFFVPVPVR